MELIISHMSAADFWRKVYPTHRAPSNPYTTFDINELATTDSAIWELAPEWVTPGFLAPENGVLHTLSYAKDINRHTKSHVAHLCAPPLPPGALYALDERRYVCSPEFTFLQLAQSLCFEQLVAYGCEICGLYCFDEAAERGMRARSRQLVTIAQLQRFIDMAANFNGRKLASKAVQYICENSASPMETTCALFLTLPYRYGGYNLPQLLLNFQIDIPRDMQSLCGRKYCVADLIAKNKRFVIEYLGTYDHAGIAPLQSDRGRTLALRELGYEVVELTSMQAWDIDSFETVAKRTAKAVGKRIRSAELGVNPQRIQLRTSLRMWNQAYGRGTKTPIQPITFPQPSTP